MINFKIKRFIFKFFSILSVIRGYNILVLVLAQYLAAIFIFSPDNSARNIILDRDLFYIVIASICVIASGYIINNFYDSEKDLINKPRKTMLDRLVSQNTKLSFYFVLNFLAVVFASYVSFKAVIFFAIYIFGIWFYSHRLKKQPIIGNIVSAILSVTPFFVIFIYYKNFELVIFAHAIFLFLLIAMRELTKDLENIKGDLALNYRTVPVVYSEKTSKLVLSIMVLLTIIAAVVLVLFFEIGHMCYFFYISVILLLIFLLILWRSNKKNDYLLLHNMLKLIIVAGVFSILLIDVSIVLNRI